MTKDTAQVVMANGGASALTLTECNQILTFISISLAIAFTIYKFYKLKNK
jgi:hypothetical protein|tara:strand:+ start:638 stop:787 length:150 start_codon:yes stop_codon:yes gene_type:complete